MFVSKKSNRFVSTSAVVIEKRKGKVFYIKTIGVSFDKNEINEFYVQSQKWIQQQIGLLDMFLEQEKGIVEELLSKMLDYLKSYFDEDVNFNKIY